MAGYATAEMPELEGVFKGVSDSVSKWRHAATAWRAMADNLKGAESRVREAWATDLPVFHHNAGDPNAKAYEAFRVQVEQSQSSVEKWGGFAGTVADRLDLTAAEIDANGGHFWRANDAFYAAETGSRAQKEALNWARLFVWNVANRVQQTFMGIDPPDRLFQGPMGAAQGDGGAPEDGDPSAQGGAGDASGAGAGDAGAGGGPADAGGAGGGGDVGGPGDGPPGDAPKEPDTPGPQDPLDRADKFFDVATKGVNLASLPFEKGLGLAQQVKDLVGQGGAGAEGAGGLDPKDLFPEGKVPEVPELSGGVGTEPTFDPGRFTDPASAGAGAGAGGSSLGAAAGGIGAATLGNQASKSAGAAGGPGAAPSLAGSSTSAPSGGAQSGMPPMYPPPMGGMGGGAGDGGRGDIKPGTAQTRSGFSVPNEPTATERWRRHGVQEDLQGRANGEERSASVTPIRKRKGLARTGRPAEQDVLDEELWRL